MKKKKTEETFYVIKPTFNQNNFNKDEKKIANVKVTYTLQCFNECSFKNAYKNPALGKFLTFFI